MRARSGLVWSWASLLSAIPRGPTVPLPRGSRAIAYTGGRLSPTFRRPAMCKHLRSPQRQLASGPTAAKTAPKRKASAKATAGNQPGALPAPVSSGPNAATREGWRPSKANVENGEVGSVSSVARQGGKADKDASYQRLDAAMKHVADKHFESWLVGSRPRLLKA